MTDQQLLQIARAAASTNMEGLKEAASGLNRLRDVCHGAAVAAKWHDKPREDGTFIALMHSELSEALEGLRRDSMDDKLPHRKAVEVELADTIIRIMDFAGLKGLDIEGAVVEKVLYNQVREDHRPEVRAAEGGKRF